MTARDAWGQVAHNLRILADSIDAAIEPAAPPAVQDRGALPRPAAAEAGTPLPASAPLPPKRTAPDTSAFTKCPAHGKDWVDGKFGPYCTGKEPEGAPHDGGWYNDRGYCRVTPKSAGAWLKQHPQGAPQGPVAQPEDVDDIPW